jgi:ornithine cyclodeaminase/alanine dehydrogenase-like protein (mu-crystallin family)
LPRRRQAQHNATSGSLPLEAASRKADGIPEPRRPTIFHQPRHPETVHLSARHSEVGVIELMPIADTAYFAFKQLNGLPGNHRHGLPNVMAFGVLADLATTAYAVGRASKVSKRPSAAKTSTAATLADRGPLRAHATTCSTACAGPATMASTDPSRRLRTQPRTPRHRACSTIDQR